MTEGGRGNIIGQISHEFIGRVTENFQRIEKEQITSENLDIGIWASGFSEQRQHSAFKFNSNHAPGTFCQLLCQDTRTSPHFQNLIALANIGSFDNGMQHRTID